MLPITLALFLVAPFTVSAATTAASGQCSKSTSQTCSTIMATVPPGFPVAAQTTTTTLKPTTISQPSIVYTTKTIAATPVTLTSTSTTILTVTSTAPPAGTNTVFGVSTAYVTSALTTTTITTGTATSIVTSTTVKWSTSTVPIPAGFTDISTSSGDSNYVGTKRAIVKRTSSLLSWLYALLGYTSTTSKSSSSSKASMIAKGFDPLKWINPVAVNCEVIIAPICTAVAATTSTITTTAIPSTITSVVKTTMTSTVVVVPMSSTTTIIDATTTSTITTQTLVTSTAQTTVTSTATQVISSLTASYAACATQNVLGPKLATSKLISHLYYYDSSATILTSNANTAYDCCVSCQTTDYCEWFQFQSGGTCYVASGTSGWCPNSVQNTDTPAYFVWDDASAVSAPLTIGNGICGIVMDLGQAQ